MEQWSPAGSPSTSQTKHILQAQQVALNKLKSCRSFNKKMGIVFYRLSCCLFIPRWTEGEKKPIPKHDHMFKPCPMNPKQDVTAGPSGQTN